MSTLRAAARAGDETLGAGIELVDECTRVDFGILLRAINALKAARLLLMDLHWEFAAGPARQIFELVVNAEYLSAQPDRRQAALQFAKYGVLQEARIQLAVMAYERETGREVDSERETTIKAMLDQGFADFRQGAGGKRWQKSWSGKNTAELASMSPAQPLRSAQYRQLFVTWSEQVHAAPVVLLPNIIPAVEPAMEDLVGDDVVEVAQVGAMCVTLYIELWGLLPGVPPVAAERKARWMTALVEEARSLGAPIAGD